MTQIKAFSNYLLILVKDLDFFSQTQVGKNIILEKTLTSIEEIISFCKEVGNCLLRKYDKKDQIQLISSNSPSIPEHIITDEGRLKQVLINLISNSIKFTQFGSVELEISTETINENCYIRFCVKDTGIGIKNELKEKLFTPFTKGTNNQNQFGAGLGLSIVRDLTEKLGTRIEYNSEYEKGSSFWFFIPVEIEVLSNNNSIYYLESSSKNVPTVRAPYFLIKGKGFSEIKNLYQDIRCENYNQIVSFDNISQQEIIINNININSEISSRNSKLQNSFSSKGQTICNYKLSDFFVNKEVIKNTMIKGKSERIFINIIITDDEVLTRKSNIRLITAIALEKNYNINIIQANDGIECLYLAYKCVKMGIKISFIFSDETMNFMNGLKCAEILSNMADDKQHIKIPLYLVSAIENININAKDVRQILVKPLNKEMTEKVLLEYF